MSVLKTEPWTCDPFPWVHVQWGWGSRRFHLSKGLAIDKILHLGHVLAPLLPLHEGHWPPCCFWGSGMQVLGPGSCMILTPFSLFSTSITPCPGPFFVSSPGTWCLPRMIVYVSGSVCLWPVCLY